MPPLARQNYAFRMPPVGFAAAFFAAGFLAAGFLAEKAQVWALLLETEVVTEGFEVRLVEY